MAVDLACAEPAFLDLTFAGLEGVPRPGAERLAPDLLRSPGGGAITAGGGARMGLSTALVSPIARDPVGALLLHMVCREGLKFPGRRVAGPPRTVVMPA